MSRLVGQLVDHTRERHWSTYLMVFGPTTAPTALLELAFPDMYSDVGAVFYCVLIQA